MRQFRTDATTIGMLSLSFSAAQFLASPVLGVLSDRYGRRPVLLWSILGSAVGYLMFGMAASLAVMFAARILDGITGGNISTAQAYIADVTAAEDRAKNFGLIGAAFGLGFIFGPALGGLLAGISVAAPAYGAAVLALATALFGYVALPESLPEEARRRAPFSWRELNPLTPLGAVTRRKSLQLLLASLFVLNFAFSGLQSNFAVFTLVRLNYSARQNALVFAYIGLVTAFVQGYLVRRFHRALGESRMAALGLGAMIAGFLGIATAKTAAQLYLAIVGVAGVGLASSALTGQLSRRGAQHEQGQILGSMQSLLSLTRVFGPLYAGLVFDAAGPSAPYLSGALWLLVALWLARKAGSGAANVGERSL